MEALLEATRDENYPAEIVFVGADKVDARGLRTAANFGISTAAIPRIKGMAKADHETAVLQALADHNVEVLCLAGYMRLLTENFIDQWSGRIINIHPSLLPKFKGLDSHQRAIDAGESKHGCSVHHVTAGMDEGPVIAQAEVTISEHETAESLAAKVLVKEHELYPKALRMLIESLN